MMVKPFEQDVFDSIMKQLNNIGVKVYPELPAKGVPYPFISLGEVQIIPKQTSSALLGKVYVTVDVWGERKQHKQVSEITTKTYELANIIKLQSKKLVRQSNGASMRFLSDNSTTQQLWHGIVSLEFIITI